MNDILRIVTFLESEENASFEERGVSPETYQEGFHWGYLAALKAVKESIEQTI